MEHKFYKSVFGEEFEFGFYSNACIVASLALKDFLGASLWLNLCSCLTLIITRNCHVHRFIFSSDQLMLLGIA